jgi:hypothetical protein
MQRINVITIGLASTFLLATANVCAAPRIASSVNVTPETTLSPQEEESISLAADRLLTHSNRARTALKINDVARAKQEVDKALVLAHMIKNVMPTYIVNTQLSAGSLKYTDQSKVQPLLVTVHEELSTEAVLEPVRSAKRDESKKEAAAAGKPIAADIRLHETRAQLDANLALVGLERAQKALSENKLDIANESLSKVQTGVILEYIVADLPLQKAQANLIIARDLMKAGKRDEAKAALKVATDSLSDYEKSAGTNRAKASADIRKEIDSISSSLQAKDNKGSQDAITRLWQTVSSLFSFN